MAKGDFEIELDSAGIRELLKGSEMQGILGELTGTAVRFAQTIGLEVVTAESEVYGAQTRAVLSVPVEVDSADAERLNVATNLAVQRHNRRSK